MTVDEFGVPDGFFRRVPEDDYRLVGRIATVAALVEVTLLLRLHVTSPDGRESPLQPKHSSTVPTSVGQPRPKYAGELHTSASVAHVEPPVAPKARSSMSKPWALAHRFTD